jgi:hypothetical protein
MDQGSACVARARGIPSPHTPRLSAAVRINHMVREWVLRAPAKPRSRSSTWETSATVVKQLGAGAGLQSQRLPNPPLARAAAPPSPVPGARPFVRPSLALRRSDCIGARGCGVSVGAGAGAPLCVLWGPTVVGGVSPPALAPPAPRAWGLPGRCHSVCPLLALKRSDCSGARRRGTSVGAGVGAPLDAILGLGARGGGSPPALAPPAPHAWGFPGRCHSASPSLALGWRDCSRARGEGARGRAGAGLARQCVCLWPHRAGGSPLHVTPLAVGARQLYVPEATAYGCICSGTGNARGGAAGRTGAAAGRGCTAPHMLFPLCVGGGDRQGRHPPPAFPPLWAKWGCEYSLLAVCPNVFHDWVAWDSPEMRPFGIVTAMCTSVWGGTCRGPRMSSPPRPADRRPLPTPVGRGYGLYGPTGQNLAARLQVRAPARGRGPMSQARADPLPEFLCIYMEEGVLTPAHTQPLGTGAAIGIVPLSSFVLCRVRPSGTGAAHSTALWSEDMAPPAQPSGTGAGVCAASSMSHGMSRGMSHKQTFGTGSATGIAPGSVCTPACWQAWCAAPARAQPFGTGVVRGTTPPESLGMSPAQTCGTKSAFGIVPVSARIPARTQASGTGPATDCALPSLPSMTHRRPSGTGAAHIDVPVRHCGMIDLTLPAEHLLSVCFATSPGACGTTGRVAGRPE